MALKVFVSSVSREFQAARRAIEDQVHRLQEMFVGMEYYGSDPRSPAELDAKKAREADVYVGLIGREYGSVEPTSQKSFTELEYQAAQTASVACLIYFGGLPHPQPGGSGQPLDDRQAAFRAHLKEHHVVQDFENGADLSLKFLVDFIKLLRGPLFDRALPLERGPIPPGALHALSQAVLEEEIRLVSQGKYSQDLYVGRAAEAALATFANAHTGIVSEVTETLVALRSIAREYCLRDRVGSMLDLSAEELTAPAFVFEFPNWLQCLRAAFCYHEVEDDLQALSGLLQARPAPGVEHRARMVVTSLRRRPFAGKIPSDQEMARTLHQLTIETQSQGVAPSSLTGWRLYVLPWFPSYPTDPHNKDFKLANELIRSLAQVLEKSTRRCAAVVDAAGVGKTNLLCHFARITAGHDPVFLLSGHMELANEGDLEHHLQRCLERHFRGLFSDWMNRINEGLTKHGQWLFVIIDGANESTQIPLFVRAVRTFLERCRSRRVKVVISCRNLSWDLFRPSLAPYLFGEVPLTVGPFSGHECLKAYQLYAERYSVRGRMDERMAERLSRPSLLHFFCRVHTGQEIADAVRGDLIDLLDLYLEETLKEIAGRLQLLGVAPVRRALLNIAKAMWTLRTVSVPRNAAGISEDEASRVESPYNLIRSEGLIVEEDESVSGAGKRVRFVYDEFMEYALARHWKEVLGGNSGNGMASELVDEAIEAVPAFSAALGAVVVLDRITDNDGRHLRRAILRMHDSPDRLAERRQTAMLFLFESLRENAIGEEVLIALEAFERVARPEVKAKLAQVLLKAAKQHPEHPVVKGMLGVILEASTGFAASLRRENPDSDPAPEDLLGRDKAGAYPPSLAKRGDGPSGISRTDAKAVAALPPARFHYSEEARLNAISLLIASNDERDRRLVDEGIKNLGKMELHSALHALSACDLAEDAQVFALIEQNICLSQAEYRIYCAWLLRERYGQVPADYFVRLLTDEATRVHRYAMHLFDVRKIEPELIRGVLGRILKPRENHPWHLRNLIRILGARDRFVSPDELESHRGEVVNGLNQLATGDNTSTRAEAYRTMFSLPALFERQKLLSQMAQDEDRHIRALALKLEVGVRGA